MADEVTRPGEHAPAGLRRLSDQGHAESIRQTLMELHARVCAAKDVGLKVTFDGLCAIGTPTWNGYHGAVKIVREL